MISQSTTHSYGQHSLVDSPQIRNWKYEIIFQSPDRKEKIKQSMHVTESNSVSYQH